MEMNKLSRTLIVFVLFACTALGFQYPENAGSFSVSTSALPSFSAFDWKWSQYDDRKITLTFDVGGMTGAMFRLSNPKTTPRLTIIGGGVSVQTNTMTWVFYVPRTNLPPNNTYWAEAIVGDEKVVTNGTVVTTNLEPAQTVLRGKVEIDISLFSYTNTSTSAVANVTYAYPGEITFTNGEPMFVASPAHGISTNDTNHWTTAYNWGNHATNGYATNATILNVITTSDITNWNAGGSSATVTRHTGDVALAASIGVVSTNLTNEIVRALAVESNKVSKTGDTISGSLLLSTNDVLDIGSYEARLNAIYSYIVQFDTNDGGKAWVRGPKLTGDAISRSNFVYFGGSIVPDPDDASLHNIGWPTLPVSNVYAGSYYENTTNLHTLYMDSSGDTVTSIRVLGPINSGVLNSTGLVTVASATSDGSELVSYPYFYDGSGWSAVNFVFTSSKVTLQDGLTGSITTSNNVPLRLGMLARFSMKIGGVATSTVYASVGSQRFFTNAYVGSVGVWTQDFVVAAVGTLCITSATVSGGAESMYVDDVSIKQFTKGDLAVANNISAGGNITANGTICGNSAIITSNITMNGDILMGSNDLWNTWYIYGPQSGAVGRVTFDMLQGLLRNNKGENVIDLDRGVLAQDDGYDRVNWFNMRMSGGTWIFSHSITASGSVEALGGFTGNASGLTNVYMIHLQTNGTDVGDVKLNLRSNATVGVAGGTATVDFAASGSGGATSTITALGFGTSNYYSGIPVLQLNGPTWSYTGTTANADFSGFSAASTNLDSSVKSNAANLVLASNQFVNLAGSTNITGALLTSRTNNFAGDELVTANWVRSLLQIGTPIYLSSNRAAVGYQPVSNALYGSASIPSYSVVDITPSGTNGQYLHSMIATSTVFGTLMGPASVSLYCGREGTGPAGSQALSIGIEFGYSYDKTNVTVLGSATGQAIVNGSKATNHLLFTVAFPNTDVTNAYRILRIKQTSSAANTNLIIYSSATEASFAEFREVSSESLGTRGATNADGSVTSTYNTTSRTLSIWEADSIALTALNLATDKLWGASSSNRSQAAAVDLGAGTNPPAAWTDGSSNWPDITNTPTTLVGYGITDGTTNDDYRLSNARTPTAHVQDASSVTGAPPVAWTSDYRIVQILYSNTTAVVTSGYEITVIINTNASGTGSQGPPGTNGTDAVIVTNELYVTPTDFGLVSDGGTTTMSLATGRVAQIEAPNLGGGTNVPVAWTQEPTGAVALAVANSKLSNTNRFAPTFIEQDAGKTVLLTCAVSYFSCPRTNPITVNFETNDWGTDGMSLRLDMLAGTGEVSWGAAVLTNGTASTTNVGTFSTTATAPVIFEKSSGDLFPCRVWNIAK